MFTIITISFHKKLGLQTKILGKLILDYNITVSSPWKMALDLPMPFPKVLPEQWQSLRLSTPMRIDKYLEATI